MLFNLRSLSLTLFSFVLASASLQAQNLEGVIEFTKTTGPVVTNYRYYVKGDRVRIEEISARGDVQGIMLVDTRDKTVFAISP